MLDDWYVMSAYVPRLFLATLVGLGEDEVPLKC
jgi:hypothetical protein